MDNVLVLVRHAQSEWNKLNLFTGREDVALTEEGLAEARRGGRMLEAEGHFFDIAFTSALRRARHTLQVMLVELGQDGLQTIEAQALSERDYGALVGVNKDDARKKWGEEQVHIWRRSFDIPPPGGESLKDTAKRVLPYYEASILPQVLAGRNVLVSAHENSLRALVMHLDALSPREVPQLDLATAVPIVYRFNEDGSVASKRDLVA